MKRTRVNGASVFMILLGLSLVPIGVVVEKVSGRDGLVGSMSLLSPFLVFSGVWNISREEPASAFPAATEDLSLAIEQLRRNFEALRSQTTWGFVVAATMAMVGTIVLLALLAGLLPSEVRLSSAVASGVLEFAAGWSLYLYRRNFDRLNQTTDEMLRLWRIRTAVEQAKALDIDVATKQTLLADLIRSLAAAP